MAIATHLVKIKGSFDKGWNEKKLRNYIDEKINEEILSYFHANLELFKIDKNNTIQVWVYLQAFPREVTEEIIRSWFSNHIKEKGIEIKSLEIKEMINLIKPINEKTSKFIIRLP